MLRFKPVSNGKRAEDYYSATDGGYYLDGTGLKSKFGGIGADRLGLTALSPTYDHVKNLGRGLDPFTGEQLTARLRANRIWGWDATGSVPKGVTEALEGGDERIQPSFWRALERAMKRVEKYAATRVRLDGRYEDRVTANLVWYAIEHPETRPVEDESLPDGHRWKLMPDPDRHIHVIIFNETWDEEEQRWKAVKFRPIMDLRKYFSQCFDAELAAEMAGLGYEIETTFKPDRKGNLKYYSWDIKGIPDSLKQKDSRRSQEVEKIEAAIVAKRKQQDKYAPDELSPAEKDKLGGTSRLTKRDDLTLSECREFWDSRRTDDERRALAETIERARQGSNPPPENGLSAAVSFSMRHHFEKESALPIEELITTALEHCMGSARPDDVEEELKRQGVIVVEKYGKRLATTAALQDEEWKLAAFAMDGRGAVTPIGVADGLDRYLPGGERLTDGQWEAAMGLLGSANRVEVITGPAGAGKSRLLRKFDQGVRLAGQSVTYLGTTSASVKVLTEDGFEANTLARFLVDEKMQAAARGGRIVVDESSILSHTDAVRLFRVAEAHDLKFVFVGDPMQHGSIGRGAFMRLMIEHGRVVPFRLIEILRQKDPAYRAAAQLLSEGRTEEGFGALDQLGWVAEMPNSQERYAKMASDYVAALDGGLKWNEALVIAPTHHEAGCVTREIRDRLRQCGRLGADEREFTRLVAVDASEAERGLGSIYHAGDIIQFHQNAKGYKKGERLVIADPTGVPLDQAARFSLYRPEKISLAVGDVLRFTGTLPTLGGQHTVRNGDVHAVAGFTEAGNIRLDNGWVISGRDPGHFRYGFVETSIGSQGRTVKQVILGMSTAMGKAVNMQQLYVSASRASERMQIYLDDKEAVQEEAGQDSRKLLALDLWPAGAAEAARREERDKRERDRLAGRRRRMAYERSEQAWRSAQRRDFGRPQVKQPPARNAARPQASGPERNGGHAR